MSAVAGHAPGEALVLVARHAGFCFGVRRVVELVEAALAQAAAEGFVLYGLGWPVHNELVVERLVAAGLRLVDGLAAVPDTTPAVRLLLRAHGEPQELIRAAHARGLLVVDATCPLVKRVREEAFRASEAGRQVVVVGDPAHPEVAGILSCALSGASQAFVAGQAPPSWPAEAPITALPQTTIAAETFAAAVAELRVRFEDVQALDLRCGAVDRRQREALALAAQVDLLLVVGSERSANTRHLVELASARVRAVRVADSAELRARLAGLVGDLRAGTSGVAGPSSGRGLRIGVTAGASTPADVVNDVAALLRLALGLEQQPAPATPPRPDHHRPGHRSPPGDADRCLTQPAPATGASGHGEPGATR